uniref:Uncharacterized protein n=1 Tax=Streptomyces kanamyceticus TaxID=1967 RepID=E9KTD1_STRKN|nr:hypothetical protein Tcs_SK_047 [Streptomyces kanamyceticus]
MHLFIARRGREWDEHRCGRSPRRAGDAGFTGPFETPVGVERPTGAELAIPKADFWRLKEGWIKEFNWISSPRAEKRDGCRRAAQEDVLGSPAPHWW